MGIFTSKSKIDVLLKTSLIIVIQQLSKNIDPHGYVTCKYSTGLWRNAIKKRLSLR